MENAVKIFQWIKNSIASRCRELNFAMGLSGPFTMKFFGSTWEGNSAGGFYR